MIKTRKILLLVLLLFAANGNAQSISIGHIENLVRNNLYHTAVPALKEYLYSNNKISESRIDEIIEEVSVKVGIRIFEGMGTDILSRSNAQGLRYIVARKLFKKGDYRATLDSLSGYPKKKNFFSPFILQLKASSYALLKKNAEAKGEYGNCAEEADDVLGSFKKNGGKFRAIQSLKDSCVVGIARIQFAEGQFQNSSSTYLDIPKSSMMWPEILFEEAWVSFYNKEYNRTLGKLVTYKSPILNHVFNPEHEVLTALTYLEMCLFNDAKISVDSFYSKYQRGFLALNNLINNLGQDYNGYYNLIRRVHSAGFDPLVGVLLKDIQRDPATMNLIENFDEGKAEIQIVKGLNDRSFKISSARGLKESLIIQKTMIGMHVKKRLVYHSRQLEKAFEGMSYIKLEVFNNIRNQIYGDSSNRSRGDLKNLERTDKQYFWTFNGEFWADELGDYVFALKSECGNAVAKN